jgi:hypothetical protein
MNTYCLVHLKTNPLNILIMSNTNATAATPAPKRNAIITMVDNARITAYEADGTRGYFQLSSTKVTTTFGSFGTTVIRDKRNCLVSGDIENLVAQIAEFKEYGIEGRIFNREFKHSELPDTWVAGVKDISKYVKIGGDSGISCKKDGEEIYRLSFYDESGEQPDVLIAHDNGAEISAAGKLVRDAAANAPVKKTKTAAEAFEAPAEL